MGLYEGYIQNIWQNVQESYKSELRVEVEQEYMLLKLQELIFLDNIYNKERAKIFFKSYDYNTQEIQSIKLQELCTNKLNMNEILEDLEEDVQEQLKEDLNELYTDISKVDIEKFKANLGFTYSISKQEVCQYLEKETKQQEGLEGNNKREVFSDTEEEDYLENIEETEEKELNFKEIQYDHVYDTLFTTSASLNIKEGKQEREIIKEKQEKEITKESQEINAEKLNEINILESEDEVRLRKEFIQKEAYYIDKQDMLKTTEGKLTELQVNNNISMAKAMNNIAYAISKTALNVKVNKEKRKRGSEKVDGEHENN